jgi:hypothetical protein
VDLHVLIQTYLSLKSISLDLFRRSNIAIHRGNLPGTFKACLRFLGGVPRTLDRLLVALSGGDAIESIRKLDLGAFLYLFDYFAPKPIFPKGSV